MRIFFSGIGGVGIGPLAQIALDAGYDVVGSDPNESLMTHELATRDVEISRDQSGEFLRDQHEKAPIDFYVYSAAVLADNPEFMAAKTLGLRMGKRDELLAEIIAAKNLKLIAIAGTHGKTTTTGMMVWVLKQLGIPASYSIGTTLAWGPSGVFNPASEFFVYECDEFDRNFLHFQPFASLITSVDYDHSDTYPTRADYREAFRQFCTQSEYVVGWQNDSDLFDVNAEILSEPYPLHLPGEHNRRNASLVLAELLNLGLSGESELAKILETFPGTNRRFEKLANSLYSDYGHHPAEIKATLQMAHELSDKVALVYQPHQNIRQHEIKDEYTPEIFEFADKIYWLPTYLSREDPSLDVLAPEQLTTKLDAKKVHIFEPSDELWGEINRLRADGYLVLAMGAGSIDGWLRDQLSS